MVKNLLSEIMIKKKKHIFDTEAMALKIESGYAQKREPEFKTKKSFSPSTLVYGSGACPRYWHLAFNGATFAAESDINPKNIASMSNGSTSHDRIQKAMENAGILIDKEIKIVNDKPPIFGFCDVVIDWDGRRIPGEIKTVREEAFNYRKVSGTPADYHTAQLLIYMRQLQEDLGCVIYESKNSHELLIIPVEMSKEYSDWLDYLYSWMNEVHTSWTDGKLAKKAYRSNSKVCKGCPIKDDCAKAKAGTETIAKLEMLV